MNKKREEKPIEDMTTEETMKKLFPKKVLEEAKKRAEEGSKKPRPNVEEK